MGQLGVVQAKVLTWVKDSHGLFDYESTQLSQKKFKIDETSSMYRDPETTEVSPKSNNELESMPTINHSNILMEIKKVSDKNQQQQFTIHINDPVLTNLTPTPISIDTPNNNIYLIVRSLKDNHDQQKGYSLQLGDIIKLGRVKCVVAEIKKQTHSPSVKSKEFRLDVEKKYEVTQPLKGVCRICLSDQEYEGNFFVSPCNCKGSCSIVHLLCLKQWISSKIVCRQQDKTVSINFSKFQCQICKDPFPVSISKDGFEHQLFYIEKPSNPYIILESLQNQGKGDRTLYLISQPKMGQFVRMGRGHQCQIRITDISVSREHARIGYQNGRFLLFDNNSKFGTLIKLQKSLAIKEQKVSVQVGRTVITCTLKPDESKEKPQKLPGLNNQKFSSYFKFQG